MPSPGKSLARAFGKTSVLTMITPLPSLLQAAKAFVAKSTKVAAVIAPLAMAAVPAEAEAEIVFGPIGSASVKMFPSSGGGSPTTFTLPNGFTQSLPPQGGFEGQQFGATHTITDLQNNLRAVFRFESSAGSSGTMGLFDEPIPFAYRFSLSASEGITYAEWNIQIIAIGTSNGESYEAGIIGDLYDDFGFGTETFHAATDLLTEGEFSDGPVTFDLNSYYLQLSVIFSASSPDDWITLTMDGSAGDGFALGSQTLTAVPEPSTYALWIGFVAVGFAAFRRRRSA